MDNINRIIAEELFEFYGFQTGKSHYLEFVGKLLRTKEQLAARNEALKLNKLFNAITGNVKVEGDCKNLSIRETVTSQSLLKRLAEDCANFANDYDPPEIVITFHIKEKRIFDGFLQICEPKHSIDFKELKFPLDCIVHLNVPEDIEGISKNKLKGYYSVMLELFLTTVDWIKTKRYSFIYDTIYYIGGITGNSVISEMGFSGDIGNEKLTSVINWITAYKKHEEVNKIIRLIELNN